MAADMRVKAPVMPPPMPVFSWTGCYLNAGVGYGFWDQEHSQSEVVGTTLVTTAQTNAGGRGWLGRFGGGCDLQLSTGGPFGNLVIGVFGDYDTMDLTGSTSLTLFNDIADEKESSAWAVGGRIGWAVAPQVLTYVSGGWAQTRFDQMNETTLFGAVNGFGFPSHTYNGWFLGGGVEYNFTWLPIQGLFLRTEYRYNSYTQDTLEEFRVATGLPDGVFMQSKKEVQTITTSLVWRFNWFH
jgi:outer membrane immunogenic protein